jgi:hypothetical protein
MSVISSGTTVTTALVQTGDTSGNLIFNTGSSNLTAMTISGVDQSVTIAGTLTANVSITGLVGTLKIESGGTNATTATQARTNLGLQIGTDVLAPNGSGAALTSLNASEITSGTIANARTTATNANVNSTIVSRDASGNFSAGTITASLNGNANTATTATSATSATTATNQSGGTVNATTMVSSGRYTRNTTGGINSTSARFALTTGQQADYHIASSVNGSSPTNTQEYGITFSIPGGNTQAGILFSENGSDGTAIGFFCTNSYASGPQLRGSFDPSGNFLAAGNVTAYSDERLKKDWASVSYDFVARLSQVKSGTYTRIDSGERQAGVSAQDMQKILPEVVKDGEHLSLAYGNAALVAAIELAKQVVELKKEIELLKAK